MNHPWILALQFSFIGLAPNAFSQALEETTTLMNDGAAREKLMHEDPRASAAGEQVHALGLGAAGEAKIYDLSSKIFEKLTLSSGGDSEKVDQQVQSLVRDPSSLESLISKDQKAQLHDLANEANVHKASGQ